jgi:hypothetical protein
MSPTKVVEQISQDRVGDGSYSLIVSDDYFAKAQELARAVAQYATAGRGSDAGEDGLDAWLALVPQEGFIYDDSENAIEHAAVSASIFYTYTTSRDDI